MNRPEYLKQYYKDNRDRIRAKTKKWQTDNKEKVSKSNFEYKLKNRYNITPKQLEVMYEEQDNSCKICNIHKDDTKIGLVVDHCHKTLEVRGLLCHSCNVSLGHLKDDTELLYKAIQYLKTNGKFN